MKPGTPIIEEALPKVLLLISEAIGIHNALKLAERFGGTSFYIPARPECLPIGHPLIELIGLDAAKKLARLMGMNTVKLPRASSMSWKIRNAAIEADHRTLSVRRLALKYRMDERSIRRILSKLRQA